jgi:hypothetical protein
MPIHIHGVIIWKKMPHTYRKKFKYTSSVREMLSFGHHSIAVF